MDQIHVLGIAGSLRQKSYNKALLHAAVELLPEGMTLEIYDIGGIPLYNEDIFQAGEPESVLRLKERIAASDALLIATPEYNWSIPGVLKNAIDWASRPPNTSPLQRKPIAIIGASTGQWGTVRAQLAWRQVFAYTNSYVLPQPPVFVNQCETKFDADGRLIDEQARGHVLKLLDALVKWTRTLSE